MRIRNHHWVFGLIAFALTGCFEVDDANNDEQVAALNEQTAALEQQNELLQQQIDDNPNVTIFGTIIDAASSEIVAAGNLTVSIGASTRAPVSFSNGSFEIENIPPNTDFELFVEPSESSYLPRAFYYSSVTAFDGSAYQDLGLLSVSEIETIEFSVINAEDDQPITELSFWYSTHQGSSSKSLTRRHVSTFSSATNTYSLSVPTSFSIQLISDLDLNSNGEPDLNETDVGYISGTRLIINSSSLANLEQINLGSPDEIIEPLPSYEFRVTVLDENFEPVTELNLQLEDSQGGPEPFVFNADLDQFVVEAEIDSRLDILIPSFELDNAIYRSSSISIVRNRYNNGDELTINFVNDRNYQPQYELPATQEIVDLVILPSEGSTSSNTELEVVLRSENLEENPNRYKVFYSSAIAVQAEELSLIQEDAITVTRGNDSPDDFVLPGSTLIQSFDQELDIISPELSLNNTLLTLQPTASLEPGFRYYYSIEEITDTLTEQSINLNDHSSRFRVYSGETFVITDMVADNNNYTNNGVAIRTANTAGAASSPNNYDRRVYLFLPLSIDTLENFVLNRVLVLEGASSDNTIRPYTIVENGKVRGTSIVNTISTAENETVSGNGASTRGTSLSDNLYYQTDLSVWSSDHTGLETNTIAFEYAYNVEGGEVQTGTITLEVQ